MPYVQPAGFHTFDLEREARYLAYINQTNQKRPKASNSGVSKTPAPGTRRYSNAHLSRTKALLASEKRETGVVRVIDGVTLGGRDVLGEIINRVNLEPTQWKEDRKEMKELRENDLNAGTQPSRQHENTSSINPGVFDALPLSPEALYNDQFDEARFWEDVLEAWNENMKEETIEERRKSFEEGAMTGWDRWREERDGWKVEEKAANAWT